MTARVTDEAGRALLDERARALAIPVRQARDTETLEVVLLTLAAETYAMESRFVFEAFRPAHVAVVPGADPPVIGITGWRGDLLTLLDLRRILALPGAEAASHAQVLVVGVDRAAFGLVVDTVEGVTDLSLGAFRPPRERGQRAGYLAGTTPDAVQLLSMSHLIRTHSGGAPS